MHGQAYGVEFFSDLIDYKDKADAAPGHQIESERYREKYVGLTVNKMMGWMSRGALLTCQGKMKSWTTHAKSLSWWPAFSYLIFRRFNCLFGSYGESNIVARLVFKCPVIPSKEIRSLKKFNPLSGKQCYNETPEKHFSTFQRPYTLLPNELTRRPWHFAQNNDYFHSQRVITDHSMIAVSLHVFSLIFFSLGLDWRGPTTSRTPPAFWIRRWVLVSGTLS